MRKTLEASTAKIPKGLRRREQKLTKMMFLIFGCFLVTYIPGLITKLVSRIRSP